MEIVREKHLIELSEDVHRQYIDARAVYTAWEDARRAAAEVRGGMYWQTKSGRDYLIRTSATNAQKSLGPRSVETEEIHKRFTERKSLALVRVADLNRELSRHQRMNRALRVGRAPNLLVEILDKLYKSGLSEYFTVIGTHSLYAYEAEAGVMIREPDALATRDVDLLWDIRRRLSFVAQMQILDTSFMELLRKVDPTFKLRDDQRYTAYNSKGFEVDLVRRMRKGDDPHPIQLTDDEDDFYVVEAERAGVLQDGATFQSIIVSTSGHMARMRTVDPVIFARTKRWLSERENREFRKRQRDALQADLVEAMLEYLPSAAR